MKMLNLLLDLICLCSCLPIAFCVSARLTSFSNETDMHALLALKNGLLGKGAPLTLSSWNTSLHFCQWQGITCGRHHQRVTALDLAGQGLTGTLSPYIGNLTFLRVLNLSDCNLKGIVPEEIGHLFRLWVFNMSRNALQGGIPLHLANCTELRVIDVSRNGLTGMIPYQLGHIPKLQILSMQQNSLTGDIPSALGNISSLTNIVLGNNRLFGSIPSSLGKLKSLATLILGINSLAGSIPSSFYNLSSLTSVSLVDNSLSGNILDKLGVSLPRLQWVAVGKNYFTGTIPPTLANISGLRIFDVGGNQLDGHIPRRIGMLKNLQVFSVGTNNIGNRSNGDLNFISAFTNLSNLWYLGLMRNQFGGVIPDSVGNLSSSLQYLNFGSNKLYGSIPAEIGNLINLAQLGMEYNNNLTGKIPASVGRLRKLGQLILGGNKLRGDIPSFIGNLTSLYILCLPDNQLEGSLPSSLQQCDSLQILNIANNRLNGDLSLEILSSLSQISTLYMSGNFFTGHIPSKVGSLIHLSILDISDNKYSGEIPVELGKCSMLETLKMGGNLFTGSIPSSLSSLEGIQILDLSRNNLSGSIPSQLQNLSHLKIFNVSFNQLEGDVPRKGVFSNLSAISLQGNKKLCGGIPPLMLPRCPRQTGRHLSPAIIIVVTLCGLLFFGFIVAFVLLYRKRSPIVKLTSYSSMKEGYLRLSYNDLLLATDHFASSNIIGVGSFGSVYRGVLKQGENEKLIAVKVMDLTRHGALKSFWTECKALSKIRHKNLLKIISCCSSSDFRGNDFMALVFELMPNGSLDSWLHESCLKLEQRLDIAIDIASALDYLHHDCVPQIAHCDMKPSNVLLDEDMVAHVGDFGLAKHLHDSEAAKDRSSSFAVKGTIGYVPPEYGMGANVSTQGDVYSFGILLLEMITGKKPTDEMFRDGLSLHNICNSALSKSTITDIVDPRLLTEFCADVDSQKHDDMVQRSECAAAIAEVGVACSMESPDERMNIGQALKQLNLIKRNFHA
uniref:non-specific serine/threonine protein kinase n=1 Tax=Kalanchoe fedtschenkoi TaxID=63787 RepID=A0A7N0UAF5_KALFE